MKFLTRQTLASAFLILCSAFFTLKSQTIEKKTSSVSGTVTMKEKGVAGLTIVLHSPNGDRSTIYHAKTDDDGRYLVTGVLPGTYEVRPDSPLFAVSTKSGSSTLIIGEGESVEGINLVITKGGVITGRVATSEGLPLIEQTVIANPIEGIRYNAGNPNIREILRSASSTDDRGVYRIFGLQPGKYTLSVLSGQRIQMRGGARVPQTTFHPAATDSSKATIIEVTEGGEAKNIDISVETNDTSPKFSVTGRVVDGSSGNPVPRLQIGVHGGQSANQQSVVSNSDGQFKIDGLIPGKYAFYLDGTENTALRIETAWFDIIDGNVNGLVVKTFKGASVSGRIVFEANDKRLVPKPAELSVMVNVRQSEGSSGTGIEVGHDWSFHVAGLPEGNVNFEVNSNQGNSHKRMTVTRIERDGIIQPGGFAVKDGDQVTGITVFVYSSTGTIRGTVRFVNGEPPADGRIAVWLSPSDSTQVGPYPQSVAVDSRGRFVFESVPAGTHEINASVHYFGKQGKSVSTRQLVTVSERAVSEVTLTLDLSAGP